MDYSLAQYCGFLKATILRLLLAPLIRIQSTPSTVSSVSGGGLVQHLSLLVNVIAVKVIIQTM